MMALFLSTSLVFYGCQVGPLGAADPTKTPAPQYCFAPFTQGSLVSINNAPQIDEDVKVDLNCVSQSDAKFKPAVLFKAVSGSTSIEIEIKELTQQTTNNIDPFDNLIVDNCTSDSNKQQSFSISKTVSAGILVGFQYYSADPATTENDFERMAHALYSQYSKPIAALKPITFQTAPIAASSHSKSTQSVPWKETFIRGVASIKVDTGIVVKDVTFAVPIQVSVDDAQFNKLPASNSTC